MAYTITHFDLFVHFLTGSYQVTLFYILFYLLRKFNTYKSLIKNEIHKNI